MGGPSFDREPRPHANRYAIAAPKPMLTALGLAIGQLSDPRLRRAIWLSLIISLAVVVGLVLGSELVLTQVHLLSIGWLDAALRVLAGAAVLFVAWLLFPATISVVVGLFLDDVAEAVELRYYPDLPPARPQPLAGQLASGLRFALVAVLLNLLVLPLYLAAIFVPPLYLFVFYCLN